MTAAQLSGLIVGLVLVVGGAALVLVVRHRGRAGGPGRTDAVSEEVVSGLLAEVRKWQAEAEYWKSQAERLQRELEDPGGRGDWAD